MAFRFAKKFTAPYPCDFSFSTPLRVGLVSGIFIFLFFLFLQPFGLAALPDPVRLFLYAGYGFLCLILIALNSIIGPRLFPRLFREEKWTIAKHLIFGTWIILTIGLACFLFTKRVFESAGISLKSLHLMMVVGGALAIGAIPFTIMTLIDLNMLLRRSDRAVAEANARIDAPHPPPARAPVASVHREVELLAENGKDSLRFAASALLYISSDENYVTVHTKTDRPMDTLLRSSLTRVEQQLGDFRPGFFRCHRAFIVNAAKIRKVSGNAQGLKLTLEDVPVSIPVARRYIEEFRRIIVPRL